MALPTHIDLQIVTPDRLLVQEQVDEVQVPGAEGYFGVLPGHTPFLATLGIGELWYRKGQEKTFLAITGGFAEVLPDRVTILARVAERAEDIDPERADVARSRAEKRLSEPRADVDYERARAALARAVIRLQVAGHAGVTTRTGALRKTRAQG
jgi:F-type H+-transporting ATPase subunit epsilon